jgi:hypothetical protein
MINGQWAMGNGQWAMSNGQWANNAQHKRDLEVNNGGASDN